jgi:plasmid maintenance system antidote protein VapI
MKQRNPSHPGELLRRLYLDEMGMTQTGLAEKNWLSSCPGQPRDQC